MTLEEHLNRIETRLRAIELNLRVLLKAEERRQRQRVQAYPGDQATIDLLTEIEEIMHPRKDTP